MRSEPPPGCDVEQGRLAWRCRRGMKELDVLLERYRLRHLAAASPQERRALEQLLRLPDPVLADCLLGHGAAPDPELMPLIRLILTGSRSASPAAPDTAMAPTAGPGDTHDTRDTRDPRGSGAGRTDAPELS